MLLSDLQEKDVINLETGNNLGKIIDVEINDEGNVISFIAEPKHFFKKFFKSSETSVLFTSVVKIGTDVILIK